MAISSAQSLPYPFESEYRKKALDFSKKEKSTPPNKTGTDYLSQVSSKNYGGFSKTKTKGHLPDPKGSYQSLRNAPSQEVIHFFRKSQNNAAFRCCPLKTPAMEMIYTKVWEDMGAPTSTTHPEIAHPDFGEHAMWDIYPCSAPNWIKIKAIESYYCSQAAKNLQTIADAFKAGKTSKALKASQFLPNECAKIEILKTLEGKIYQNVWKLTHKSKPYNFAQSRVIYWTHNKKAKASNILRAQAVENCIASCIPRTDKRYQEMVEKAVPIEFLLQRAAYAFNTIGESPTEYCEQAMKISTHAEIGLVHSSGSNLFSRRISNSDDDSSDEVSASEIGIPAIESYLKKIAILKMGCIATAFKTDKESLAYCWSAEFFTIARNVKFYGTLEGQVYGKLWQIVKKSSTKKTSLKHPDFGRLAYWKEKGMSATAEQRAQALITASRGPYHPFPLEGSDSGSDSEDGVGSDVDIVDFPKLVPQEGLSGNFVDSAMSYTNTALTVIDGIQLVSLAVYAGPVAIAIPCATSLGGAYLTEKLDQQVESLGKRYLSEDGQEQLASARKYVGYGLTAYRAYSVGQRLYTHGVGSLFGYSSQPEARPVKVQPKISAKRSFSRSTVRIASAPPLVGPPTPAHLKHFERASSHAIVAQRGTINGLVTQPLAKYRNRLKDALTDPLYGKNKKGGNKGGKTDTTTVTLGGHRDSDGNWSYSAGASHEHENGEGDKTSLDLGVSKDSKGNVTVEATGKHKKGSK